MAQAPKLWPPRRRVPESGWSASTLHSREAGSGWGKEGNGPVAPNRGRSLVTNQGPCWKKCLARHFLPSGVNNAPRRSLVARAAMVHGTVRLARGSGTQVAGPQHALRLATSQFSLSPSLPLPPHPAAHLERKQSLWIHLGPGAWHDCDASSEGINLHYFL